MAVSVGVDADILELVVAHLHEHVHGDLLLLKDVPQRVEAQAGEEGGHADGIELFLHLGVGLVDTAVT